MPDNPPGNSGGRVFVNCPFAAAHRAIFDAVVFALIVYKFKPLLAQHRRSGGRLDFIREQVAECAFSVHDITPLLGDDGGTRQNTAFELGLWMGAKRDNDTLILVADERALSRSFSDLKGYDCVEYHGDGGEVVRKLAQELLRRAAESAELPNPSEAVERHRKFCASFDQHCKEWGWKQNDDLAHRIRLIWEWSRENLQDRSVRKIDKKA